MCWCHLWPLSGIIVCVKFHHLGNTLTEPHYPHMSRFKALSCSSYFSYKWLWKHHLCCRYGRLYLMRKDLWRINPTVQTPTKMSLCIRNNVTHISTYKAHRGTNGIENVDRLSPSKLFFQPTINKAQSNNKHLYTIISSFTSVSTEAESSPSHWGPRKQTHIHDDTNKSPCKKLNKNQQRIVLYRIWMSLLDQVKMYTGDKQKIYGPKN